MRKSENWSDDLEIPKGKGIEKWLSIRFESSSALTPQFSAFARDFKKAILNKLTPGECLIGWSRGHFYCSGFIKRGVKFVYFSISDVRHFPNEWYSHILIRTAKDERDYTGGINCYTDINNFGMNVDRLLNQEHKRWP